MKTMTTGTVLGILALLAQGALAADPSFDCAKAESSAEEAVCASDGLASMDRELARLYLLAVSEPDLSEDRLRELKGTQRGWIKGRDDCWKSSLGLEACVAAEYAFRIMDIRTGYAVSRTVDGASDGPYPYVCEGLDAVLSAVFVTTSEPMVALRWQQNAIALPQEPAASGARYAAQGYEFWISGSEAMLTTPERGRMGCKRDSMG